MDENIIWNTFFYQGDLVTVYGDVSQIFHSKPRGQTANGANDIAHMAKQNVMSIPDSQSHSICQKVDTNTQLASFLYVTTI